MRTYTKDDYGFLWLDLVEDITLIKKIRVAYILKNGSNMWNLAKFKNELMDVLDDGEYGKLVSSYDNKKFNAFLKYTLSKNVNFITINSPEYPEVLKKTANPPFILYYIGNVELLSSSCIAVIGSRLHSSYGTVVTEKYAKELAFNGFTIVSGLAEGIDTIAHNSCLDIKGKTIAVLCGGLDKIYPSINTNLARRIVKSGGLLISENRLGVEPQKFLFPIRNRIIAGLSIAVVLTEAHEKSGTKHTINYATDANRNIYCVPNSILNERGVYGNQLIKDCQTFITLSPQDVVEDLGFNYKDSQALKRREIINEIDEVGKIREILEGAESVHFDEILKISQIDTKKLNSMLTKLELSGIIKKLPGNFYMLCD